MVRAKAVSLAEEVYDRLKEDIIKGVLPPGDALTEADISKQLGISRTPVREALRRLKTDGLVSIEPGLGARVSEVSLRDAIEMYEIRELVEPPAAGHAARSLSPELAECLRSFRTALATQPPAPEQAMRWQVDRQLHDLILQAAGNNLLRELVWGLRVRTERAFIFLAYRVPDHSRQEHIQIIDAILAGDGETAERLVREHLARAKERLIGK